MIDGIIKADGTSRLMKSELPATYEEFRAQCHAGTQPLDVLFNATGWSQLPTFLNKGNLQKDTTAALFGKDSNAVPDDLFAWIGQYNTHWWSVLHGQGGYGYEEVRTAANTGSFGSFTSFSANEVSSQTIMYSTSINIDQSTGAVSLVNPQTATVTGGGTAAIVKGYLNFIFDNVPVYITNLYGSPNTIFYVPTDATFTNSYGNTSTQTFGATRMGDGYAPVLNTSSSCTTPVYVVTSQVYNIPAGATTYEHSTDRNAYPDSGTVDGLTYQYLGIPFQNAVTAPKIETGSYNGTGTYGESNPNSLTFDFEPKLVICGIATTGLKPDGTYWSNGFVWYFGTPIQYTGSGKIINMRVDGNTLSWYSTNDMTSQLNYTGQEYNYIAIG